MSMGDSDIDLFLSQTNALDSSFYVEPPEALTHSTAFSPANPSTHMETLPSTYSHVPPFKPSLPQTHSTANPVGDISFGLEAPLEKMEQTPHTFINQRFPMNPREPTPSPCFQNFLIDPKEPLPSVDLPRQCLPINPQSQLPQEYFAPQNIRLPREDQPTHFSTHYPQMNTHEKNQFSGEFLPPPYDNFQNQSSQVAYRSFGMSSNFSNAMADLLSHDREAILSFLAGEVRPGPNVTEIYKCSECIVQFPNAQAFGGHMSFHSKNKRTKEGNSIIDKYGTEASSSNSSRRKAKRRAKVSRKAESKKKKTSGGMKLPENKGIQNDHNRDVSGEMRHESVKKANREHVVEDETSFKL